MFDSSVLHRLATRWQWFKSYPWVDGQQSESRWRGALWECDCICVCHEQKLAVVNAYGCPMHREVREGSVRPALRGFWLVVWLLFWPRDREDGRLLREPRRSVALLTLTLAVLKKNSVRVSSSVENNSEDSDRKRTAETNRTFPFVSKPKRKQLAS